MYKPLFTVKCTLSMECMVHHALDSTMVSSDLVLMDLLYRRLAYAIQPTLPYCYSPYTAVLPYTKIPPYIPTIGREQNLAMVHHYQTQVP